MLLLEEIAKYLATKLGWTVATNVFYYEMPATPDACVAVLEPKEGIPVLPQLNAEIHYVAIETRANDFVTADVLANTCKAYLLKEDNNEDTEATGIINLSPDLCAAVNVLGNPVAERIDQQLRKYFIFHALFTIKRI